MIEGRTYKEKGMWLVPYFGSPLSSLSCSCLALLVVLVLLCFSFALVTFWIGW